MPFRAPRQLTASTTTAAIAFFASLDATITTSRADGRQAPTARTAAPDTAPPFARARRLSDADLTKKREGQFLTGLPDLSSDPWRASATARAST